MGRVDLHLHLLPGIDDGSKSMVETLAMAKALTALGYTHLAPSPHARGEYASKDAALCATKLEEVRTALAGQFELFTNAENFFLEDSLFPSIAAGTARTLGSGKVLLIEAPYQGPLPMLPELIFRMKVKGYTPLIAHPERCMEFDRKGRAAEVVRAGALLQLDMGALIGRYGKTAERLGRQFLDDGLYQVAATDLHSPVNAEAWVGDSLKAIEKAVGAKALEALTITNPAALLQGIVANKGQTP
ncbi:MAG: protein tyrosine phosphatase [Archangium sp.]|nr:protein tyrosine phosphatase [Archangium sp.]